MIEWFEEAAVTVMPLFAMYGVISLVADLSEIPGRRRARKRRDAERIGREERLRKTMEDADDVSLRLRLRYGPSEAPGAEFLDQGIERALARKLSRISAGEEAIDEDAKAALALAAELGIRAEREEGVPATS